MLYTNKYKATIVYNQSLKLKIPSTGVRLTNSVNILDLALNSSVCYSSFLKYLISQPIKGILSYQNPP